MSVQLLEDIAMMRALPNMKIVVPADAAQAADATEALATIEGPAYLRLGRADTPLLFADHDFEFGRAQLLREGDAATVVACGYMVFRALVAADELAREGIEVEVINAHTLKPFDEETLIRSLLKTRAVVTAEDAQKFGGLGGIVAEIAAKNVPVPQEFVAVNDIFGQSGTSLELNKSRGLMPEDIVAAVRKVIVRKL
jgi:transketolase